jgi:uncharacterized protein
VGILTDDMRRVVREQRLAFVATVSPDGTPNLSPKGSIRVWDGDQLMFADLRSPSTVRNLQSNPSIDVNIVDQTLRRGYRFQGSATVVRDGPQFEAAMATFRAEIENAGARIRAVVFIRVERALSLTSPAYDTGRTAEDVRASWQRHWDELRAQAAR